MFVLHKHVYSPVGITEVMQLSCFSQGWEANEVEIANSSREKLLAILGITAVSHGWFIASLTVAHLVGCNTNESLMGAPSLAQSSRTANRGTWRATWAKQARKTGTDWQVSVELLSFLSLLCFHSHFYTFQSGIQFLCPPCWDVPWAWDRSPPARVDPPPQCI